MEEIFDDNQRKILSYCAAAQLHQCHPYKLDNLVDQGHTNRQICHMPNNHGLTIDRKDVS
jgi:hypothetical protein